MKKVLLFASVIGLSIHLQAQNINIPKGLTFETTTVGNMSMDMMGQKMTMEANSSMITKTIESNDAGLLFANTFKKMTMKMDGMGQNINFDSDKKEDLEGPMGSVMKSLIDSTQEVGVNKQGKVTKFSSHSDGSDQFIDAMNLAGQIVVGMPYYMLMPQSGKTVKVGDAWVDSSSASSDAMRSIFHYTLKNITPTDITVTLDGTLMLDKKIQQQSVNMNVNMKGDATYDKATGLLKVNNSVYEVTGKVDVMGQSMPITLKGTSVITVKK